jgi:hypothetical protein
MSAHKSHAVAIAALLLAGATSIAVAQSFDPSVSNRGGFDPNMANRYPAHAGPIPDGQRTTRDVRLQSTGPHYAPRGATGPIPGGHLTTRDVRLQSTGPDHAPRGASESWMDRASQVWDGGAQ